MAEFNRSKFKGTKLSSLNKTKKEADKHSKSPLSSGGDFLDFHKVEEGVNKFRIMPPLKENEISYYPKRTAWLEVGVPDKEDESKIELKRKPIFISTIHGNKELRELGKDPIELYIKYIQEMVGDIDDKEERKEFLKPVTNWQFGIMPQTVYACYAVKDGKLANFELYDSYMKEMNKIVSAIEDEEGELEFDIFSDPDEGYPLIIKKEANTDEKTKKNKKWIITVSEGKLGRGESWEDFYKKNRVSDAQLQELSKQQSLKERFVDNYSMREFDLAIDGLKRFDSKNEFNIFENEEFLNELEEIQKLVPQPKSSNKDVEDAFDLEKEVKKYTKVKLKKFLKNYVSVNYEDQEDEYNEAINELDKDELLEWALLAVKKEDLPELEGSEEDDDDDVEVPDDVESEEEESEEEEELPRRRRRS